MLPRRLKKNRHIDRLKSIDHTPLKQGYIPASGVFFSPHTNTLIQGLAIPRPATPPRPRGCFSNRPFTTRVNSRSISQK